ncbi:ABC transporter permease [Elioraea rosea]|uniref:ABC transporter permease n=1 Tax=Elioraea rosea TaxID=2492390 RepID=UPI001183C9FE|nr:ABC transporter permease [Elioraea rosea]
MAAEAVAGEAAAPRRAGVVVRALGHRGVLIGLALFGAVVLIALFADWIAPHDPVRNNFRYRLGAPNDIHWLGTDRFGRDILSRIIHGTRVSLRIGLMVVVTTGVLGALLGAMAGYFRALDGPIMRVMDGLMAFPGILLAVSLAAALGPSETNAAIALTVAYTPRTARIVRASVLVVREMEYVEAARALGAGHAHILFRHILPNSLTPLVVQSTYIFALSILAEAVLSFIGVGPPPPTPSLGSVIADGRDYMLEAPWISLFPGLAIAVTVLGLNLLGDGLRDVLDPRMKVEMR